MEPLSSLSTVTGGVSGGWAPDKKPESKAYFRRLSPAAEPRLSAIITNKWGWLYYGLCYMEVFCDTFLVIHSLLSATSMAGVKKSIRCYFVILNSVLTPINNIFAPIIDVKMGCHFNNLIFFIKKYN